MSSSPWRTSRRSPRRSATSVTFQLVGPTRARSADASARASVAPQDEPDGGAVVGLDAPAVREPADEVEAEAAGLVQRADPRRGREAVAVVGDLDADLGVPVACSSTGSAPSPWRTALVTTSETSSLQRLDLAVGEVRGDRVADPRARLGDRAGLRRERQIERCASIYRSACPAAERPETVESRVVTRSPTLRNADLQSGSGQVWTGSLECMCSR